ncbi:B-cell differentiation antigen CD72-like [Colius striatus]|uniref:B-cell differentiation antigen CD72-like n=1 Tax=Colius striatus TaxID=57412 RepID=UPI002B1E258F|nr:B-cell differentiation antigen CD72-like [Colius striatus]
MAQSVLYADLKFAAARQLTPTPACPAAPDEDDSPYENVPLGTVPAAAGPGRWPRRWRITTGLLAASLLLLLLLTTITLGACYWQVSRRLQDAALQHATEQGRLWQKVSEQEQGLEQTRLELAWARAELQRAWRDGNSSQLELGSLSAELGRVRGILGQTEREMQEVQGKLNSSESTVAILRACVNTECCPQGWVLYRRRCLFISVETKKWLDSYQDCSRKSAQLLSHEDWPHFVQQSRDNYWIRSKYQNFPDSWRYDSSCEGTHHGKTASFYCFNKLLWICEKPADLSSPSKTLTWPRGNL